MANETPSGPFDFIELRRSVPIFPVAIASVSISIALLPNQLGGWLSPFHKERCFAY